MDSIQLDIPKREEFVRTYLLASIPIIVFSYILGGWLTGIVTPYDTEYIGYLERNHGEVFHVQLYENTRLYIILFGTFIGNIGYIFYYTQFESPDIVTFYTYLLKYTVVGFVGGLVFYIIGSFHASIQYPWTSTSTVDPSGNVQNHYRVKTYYTTVGIGLSVLGSVVWEYYEDRKDKKEKQKEEFVEIKEDYLQAREISSKTNASKDMAVPTKYEINNTNSIEEREEKLDLFRELTNEYISIIDIGEQTEEKLTLISEEDGQEIQEAKVLVAEVYDHISEGNESNLDDYKEKLLEKSNKLDIFLEKEILLNKLANDSEHEEISDILTNSIKNTSANKTLEKQIQSHEQLFDTYRKIDQVNYPALSDSKQKIKQNLIDLSKSNERIHLQKDEINELEKIVDGLNDFVSFSKVNNPEYTDINTSKLVNKIELAVSQNDYSIISDEINSINKMKNSIWKPSDLYNFTWEEFEYLIADLWEDKGYRTNIGSQVADKGIDVTATKKHEKVAIQVKQFSQKNKVGARVIRNTGGVLPRGFDRVAVVTSSSFTSPAREEADGYGNRMMLINGENLIMELNNSDLIPPNYKN